MQQSVLADIYYFCHRNKQIARECLSRDNSTSEDCEPFVVQEFTEKDSDEEKDVPQQDVVNRITSNPSLVSSLKILASKEPNKERGQAAPKAKDNRPLGAPMPNKLSAKGKPRFTITRIMESIGNASADVANKFTGNVSSGSRKSMEAKKVHGSSSFEKPLNVELKTLNRQPNVDLPNPVNSDAVSSPTRARNQELKEFYRRLKDGEIDNSQYSATDIERNIVSTHKVNDNLIEKLPFPGMAKKLNDCVEDDSVVAQSRAENDDKSENCNTEELENDSSEFNSIEIVNGSSETD